MSARAKIASVAASGAVLLIGWQLGTQGQTLEFSAASTTSGTTSGTSGSDAPSSGSTGSSSSGSGDTASSGSASSGSASSGSASSGSASSGSTSSGSTGSGETSSGSTGSGETSSSSGSSAGSGTSSAADGTYTGDAVQTRFGSVQVSVTISGGAITDVTAVKLTDAEQRSVMISNQAAPILRQEVLSAQSADVSTVSRATVTSEAYLQSLESALEEAGW
ncbi:FMN-binding protein [Microbacterium oryzae]|uniref:FMN-binding protein n=1 Tax=Microbacterium oryzae TaxID=743009 RepID=UPI0025AF2991|nr:FMN-binding protein [Microbacterium oryzae]MDN3310623.1 FMN-binding protein [Microbacterium oryzae]